MSRQTSTASIVASPVLVGAVTLLVSIIAVFIAYNANSGLPFVPTYDLKAELPSGNKLVAGNEVRAGGFRVGVIDAIEPAVKEVDGERRAVALFSLKLDKTVEPLATDTTIRARPRSALGLKYLELTPGAGQETFAKGATIPLSSASEGQELEDIFATFDEPTRVNARAATKEFGDAFAGRGQSLNRAIEAFNPFFRSLLPVMTALSDPDTQLDQFFTQLGRTAAQVAPVASVQADLFSNMATTFAAFSENPAALQATIEKSPATLDAGISSFRVSAPFLGDFADLSARLRPAIAELPRSLPAVNRALRTGIPVLPRSADLSRRLERAFEELDDLFENPNTLMAIRDLRTATDVTTPALEFIGPYQTVCSYGNYFLHALGEHQSQKSGGGTFQNQGVKLPNLLQPNEPGSTENSRPQDLPTQSGGGFNIVDGPYGATYNGMPATRLYLTPYSPAIDAQGNADCQSGQNGWIRGPALPPYTRSDYKGNLPDGTPKGANQNVGIDNIPGLSGGTYISRRLGINSLQDVDKLRVP